MESIVLGIYLWFKKYFLIDTNAKMWAEIIDLVVLGRNYWSSCRVWKYLSRVRYAHFVGQWDNYTFNQQRLVNSPSASPSMSSICSESIKIDMTNFVHIEMTVEKYRFFWTNWRCSIHLALSILHLNKKLKYLFLHNLLPFKYYFETSNLMWICTVSVLIQKTVSLYLESVIRRTGHRQQELQQWRRLW